MSSKERPIVIGVSGASGAVLAHVAIQRLGRAGYPLVLVATEPGMRVWKDELGVTFKASVEGWAREFVIEALSVRDIGASIASGSYPTRGMMVIPCSTDVLSAIAHGRASNLLERAADVTIKEARPLVLVPRETPLSAIHLENMLTLARLGVRIVPPMPAFYLRPSTVAEIVEALVDRVFSAFGLDPNTGKEKAP